MKHIVLLSMLIVLLVSCETGKGEIVGLSTPKSGKQNEFSDEYKVYIYFTDNRGVQTSLPINNTPSGLFTLTNDVIGSPFITQAIIDGFIPGLVDNSQDKNFQWTVKGKINNGYMAIEFPDGNRDLSQLYESTFTKGVRVAEILISNKSGQVDYELRKLIEKDIIDFGNYEYNNHRIHIYYVNKDFDKFNSGKVSLKSGWNFVETFTVLYKDGRKHPFEYETGLVSQDISDFYKAGYRWFYNNTSVGGTPQ